MMTGMHPAARALTALTVLAALGGCGPAGGQAAPTPGAADPFTAPVAAAIDADARGLPPYLACLREQGAALVSAHRGGPAPGFPENALESFTRIVAESPALLEVDVRATSDGVLVLLHDRTLDRTTDCDGELAARPMDAIRACRLRDNDGVLTSFAIPTLAEALVWAKDRTVLQLDIKARALFPATVELVRQADAFDRVVFITYTPEAALEIAQLSPVAVVSTSLESPADLADLAAGGLPRDRVVAWLGYGREDPARMRAFADAGVTVSFGTLGFDDSIDDQIAESGDFSRYARIADSGVGLIATDAPLIAAAALADADDPTDELAACNVAE